MTLRLAKCVVAAFAACGSSVAAAQTASQEAPDLVGTWQCTSDGVAAYHGFQPAGEWQHRMVITDQLGLTFRGYIQFKLDKSVHSETHINIPGHDIVSEDGDTVEVQEAFVGTIGWNDTFLMVDHGDLGIRTGFIEDENTLKQVFGRPGEAPLASRETCTRWE